MLVKGAPGWFAGALWLYPSGLFPVPEANPKKYGKVGNIKLKQNMKEHRPVDIYLGVLYVYI